MDKGAHPRVILPCLGHIRWLDRGRKLHALANAWTHARLMLLNESSERLPDFARLDDAENLAPPIESIGRNAGAHRVRQLVRHVVERSSQERGNLCIRFCKGIIEYDQVANRYGRARALQEHIADALKHAGAACKPPRHIE